MTSPPLAGRPGRSSGPAARGPASADGDDRAAGRGGASGQRRAARLRCAISALAFAACALAAGSLGHAADLRVLLVGPSASDPLVTRVRQELALLGLDVEIVLTMPGAELASLAREHGAAAAARVEESPPAIVLWVDEAHSAGLPQESRIAGATGADPGLLPLRAIELLRGRLLTEAPEQGPSAAPSASGPVPVAPGPIASTEPPSATAPAGATPPPSRLHVHAGPALAVSPGGVPVAASLRAGAAWRLVGPLEVAGLVVVPLSAGSVGADEGSIDLRVLAVGAGAAARWEDVLPRLELRAGAGAGLSAFLFEGRATAPWISASGVAWAAMPYVDLGAGYRLTELVAVRLDAIASLAFPPPVLVIAGREVASFGAPGVFLSLAAELRP